LIYVERNICSATTKICKSIKPLESAMTRNRLARITLEAGICGGRPCIRGYRIRVSDILGLLGSGASHAEILEDYPFLEDEDILAALDYAAIQTNHPILIAA
jgi:uncharacterized protein (DUF433 family)